MIMLFLAAAMLATGLVLWLAVRLRERSSGGGKPGDRG